MKTSTLSLLRPAGMPHRHGWRRTRAELGISTVAVLSALVVALVLVGVGVALATLTGGPKPREPLVTVETARSVTHQLWKRWQKALARHDTRLLEVVDDGGIQLADDVASCGQAAAPWDLAHGCSELPFLSSSVAVPLERHYPVYFLAQVRTRQWATTVYERQPTRLQPSVVLLVIARRSSEARWRIAFRTTFFPGRHSPTRFLAVPSSDHGFDPASHTIPPAPVKHLPALLAAYYQACWTSGKPPPTTLFLPGSWTTTFCSQIASLRNPQETIKYSSDPSADGLWTFNVGVRGYVTGNLPLQVPWRMVCSLVLVTITTSPAPPSAGLIQRSTRQEFGHLLRPGVYRKVVGLENHDDCIITDGNIMSVIGNGGTTYRKTGITTPNSVHVAAIMGGNCPSVTRTTTVPPCCGDRQRGRPQHVPAVDQASRGC